MQVSEHYARVREFMKKAGQTTPDVPEIPSLEIRQLRARLILEEALETIAALGLIPLQWEDGEQRQVISMDEEIGNRVTFEPHMTKKPNLVEIADGCADISVVTIGTLIACGVKDADLLRVVDESNLAKFKGDAHRDPGGKWIKPSDWEAPDIEAILHAQVESGRTLG